MRKGFIAILAFLFIMPSTISVTGQDSEETPLNCSLNFNGELANESVHFHTDLGPRIAGSLARSERVAKYNRLLRIEEELGNSAKIAKI